MSEAADIAARTQRFNEAARTFTPPSPRRHAKLMPLKDGIVELRQKGASLRLIRELLATVDVAVGTDTIARFLAEVNGDQTPQRASRRTPTRRHTVVACCHAAEPSVRRPNTAPQTAPPSERPAHRRPAHRRSAQPLNQRTIK